MSEFKKITNLIPGDVVVEDLGVRLRGLGDSRTVPAEAAAASADLGRNSRFVKVETIRTKDKVPFWPFVRERRPDPRPEPVQAPSPSPSPDLSALQKQMEGIASGLQALLERPPPAPPEVVAAHVRTAQSRSSMPLGFPGGPNLPGAGTGDEPLFIPSKIVPDEAEASIKVSEEAVDKGDFEEGLAALRRAKRGK